MVFRYVSLFLTAFVLALSVLSVKEASACSESVTASELNSVDAAVRRRELGAIIVEVYPSSTGSTSRVLQIADSGCVYVTRQMFGRRPVANIYVANNGDWGDEQSAASFALLLVSSLTDVKPLEPVFLYRNGNSADRSAIWVRRDGAAIEGAEAYRSDILSIDSIESLKLATTAEEMDEIIPGFLARLSSRGEKPGTTNRYDLLYYTKNLLPLLSQYAPPKDDLFMKHTILAVAFDGRNDNGGSAGKTPRMQINISGPCTYINMSGPVEALQRRVTLQVKGEGVECSSQ